MAIGGSVRLVVASVMLSLFVYDGVLRPLAAPLMTLPLIPGGLTTLTVILVLFSLWHASYTLGARLTAVFLTVTAVTSWTFEEVGVITGLIFGHYHYTTALGPWLGSVPILIPLAWFMMIYPSYITANLLGHHAVTGTPSGRLNILGLSLLGALVMTAWDLIVDPILSGPSVRAWVWERGGPYFGVPLQNFAGWVLTTFVVYLLYRSVERRWSPRPAGPLTEGASAMPIGAYLAMLVADLLSGAAPAALAVIGPLAMGIPGVAAALRLHADHAAAAARKA